MKQALINYMQKEKFDNINTPIEAIMPVIKYVLDDNWFIGKKVWECCDPGDSLISKAFRALGYTVVSTDIRTGTDFLTSEPKGDVIITNPPYSIKNEFLERAFTLGIPFAFLLPITSLASISRNRLFSKYGISVIVLDKRIDFTGKGNNWFDVGWFTYCIGKNNELRFAKV